MNAVRRDVLGELFSGEAHETVQGLEELNALIQQCAAPQKASIVAPKKRSQSRCRVRKATHYLRPEVYDRLEAASQRLRDELAPDVRVSKSRLVNLALAQLLEEIRRKDDPRAVARLLEEKS
ncbi:hypothetical protein TDMWS_12280 [Thermodesulfomicrobium sp. WS]|uniref:hypothetical protein n=1 Tax=Thermodesulfomicrobium sp. WS TaxID=3004129 RepID=UPI002493997C|nr:hypothetical protein [Thermodesulfomicrobium sp. WS]BDV01143.1 hypothetical protein TDMWS_12280 [Thermodesulfomicrobium sp. WS]